VRDRTLATARPHPVGEARHHRSQDAGAPALVGVGALELRAAAQRRDAAVVLDHVRRARSIGAGQLARDHVAILVGMLPQPVARDAEHLGPLDVGGMAVADVEDALG
jgi:hypothetical protein